MADDDEQQTQQACTFGGFLLADAVRDLPFSGWRALLLPLAEKHGPDVNEGIEEHVRVFRDVIPVFPAPDAVLRAFRFFDVEDTRVVIIGQDCYPTPGDATGLCFSVPSGSSRCPPSLRNVFKELRREYGVERMNYDLSDWAEQGVLLLNTALTVRSGCAGSHLRMWRGFTTDTVRDLAKHARGVCFMLWGAHAIEYEALIPSDRGHLVLKHSHPSPLSRKPFEGCGHFGRANAFLASYAGKPEIAWVVENSRAGKI